ncbi:MAG: LicD family protein [Oscillospiraceae bacterium]|nr:LicD family protein [Oscillospiraceae bacterium]
MTDEYGNLELHKVLLAAMKDIDKICRENGLRYYLYAGTLLGAVNFKGFIPWDDDVDIVMLSNDYNKFKSIIERDYGERYKMMTFDNTANWYSKMSKLQVLGTEIITNNGEAAPIFVDISTLHNMPDNKLSMLIQRKKIEFYNLSLAVLSGAVIPTSLKSKLTIGQMAKQGKDKLGKKLDTALCRYDRKRTKYVGIMCNTICPNPYTGKCGYITDRTEINWHDNPRYVEFEDTKLMTISNIEDYLDWQYGTKWREPYPKEKRITKHNVREYQIDSKVREWIGK